MQNEFFMKYILTNMLHINSYQHHQTSIFYFNYKHHQTSRHFISWSTFYPNSLNTKLTTHNFYFILNKLLVILWGIIFLNYQTSHNTNIIKLHLVQILRTLLKIWSILLLNQNIRTFCLKKNRKSSLFI